MQKVVFGINEDDLSSLSLEVIDYADRISEIFGKIDLCMERLSNYYKGQPYTELVSLYKEMKPFYPIIKGNILSYSDDFIRLINGMKENDKFAGTLFQDRIDDTMNKMKSIEK